VIETIKKPKNEQKEDKEDEEDGNGLRIYSE
jgi:hypothetical protein